MESRLEIVEGDLPHHSVEHILDLAGKKAPPDGDVVGAVDKLAEGQHLGKYRSRFGKRQWRVGH